MSAPAAFPSPLGAEQSALVARLTDGLDGAGLWWLSGYAAGLAQRAMPRLAAAGPAPATPGFAPVADAVAAARLTIVFGSQTGNAKRVAEQLARQAEANGLAVRLLRADAYPLRELKDETLLAVVISTQGDGEPPDDARGFVEHLAGRRAPRLERLKFAVLGLGDSSYPQFNAVARSTQGSRRWAASACSRAPRRTSTSTPSPRRGSRRRWSARRRN